ncbi:hypothetical protein [Amycolatopsis silviterrae]|uniref:HNH endonuclease n=1 Tax=Amycolatopsis silviterrae TaxID=1656914 RepID=A0ABW5H3L5_9PSEU
MFALDDAGRELNAEFSVGESGGRLSLVLESAGGQGKGPWPRNHEYVPALKLLLGRLRERKAVLVSGVVASSKTVDLPEEKRSIVPAPIDLAAESDLEQLRRQLTRAQGKVGLSDSAAKDGNNRKRIELRLQVPGYGPGDAARLAADLAAPSGSAVLPRAEDLLGDLVGSTIPTVTGRENKVLAVQDGSVLVGTDRSPEGQPVPIADIQHGLDVLAARGSLQISVDELGHRSAFVGAVLSTLPHAIPAKSPATVTLDSSTAEPDAADRHFGELDAITQVKVRTEQTRLRRLLANERESAPCALCGDEFPLRFLVAAHVKKRAACTDTERRNLRDIAMLACSFGCDILYESGWVTVGEDGLIQTVPLDQLPAGSLKLRMEQLAGRRCEAHRPESEPYFAWHRTTTFVGRPTA